MKQIRRLSCFLLALAVVLALPVQALAQTYDLDDGSVEITTDATDQYVSQNGGAKEKQTSPTVITQTSSAPTSSTITINTSEQGDKPAQVTIDGVNIDVSGTGDALTETQGAAAVSVEGSAQITLSGDNTAASGAYRAGIEVKEGSSVIISGKVGASLEAAGGFGGAGIGGASNNSNINSGNAGSVTINGGDVTATGGTQGAGIGGGYHGDGGSVIVNGGTVKATGNYSSAGIGGGDSGNGGTTTINGGEVTAQGQFTAAGIGGGFGGDGGTTTITGGTVTAIGGTGAQNISGGAGIGGGGGRTGIHATDGGSATVSITGGTVTATAGANSPDPAYADVAPSADIGGGGGPATAASNVKITGGTVTTSAGVIFHAPTPMDPPTSLSATDTFWSEVNWQITKAEQGSTFPIDAGSRILIPSYVLKTAAGRNITLVITWADGEITIAPGAALDLSQWCVYLKDL